MSRDIPGNRKHLTLNDRLYIKIKLNEGHSPYQIAANHPELGMSLRSIYTYIDRGYFTARNIDPKKKPKFRKRKAHKTQITDREVFVGRIYDDFCSLDDNARCCCVEIDTAWFFQKEPSLSP